MLDRSDLWSLEDYSRERENFRTRVLAHKSNRRVTLGGHILLTFEDDLTVKYQIQEMLRIEKIFESTAIREELDAYNPLTPDGDNWKCTMLIQYEDVEERKQRLGELIGIEDRVWVKIGEGEKIYPIADEDLERSNAEKTSAVHFMRYQLSQSQVEDARSGESIVFGVDHIAYPCDEIVLNEEARHSLIADLK